MSNIVIKVNESSTTDGFLIAPDNGSTFPVPLNLSTNDLSTVSATMDATPNGAGITLPVGAISIGPPPGMNLSIQASQVSAHRKDTVINVRINGVITASFELTAISNPEIWFQGRFEARFATDGDYYNNPRGTDGGTPGHDPNDNDNGANDNSGFGPSPGWTWALEGEPDFVPSGVDANGVLNSIPTSPDKPVGRVVRFNSPVALRQFAAPVATSVNEVHGKLADSSTVIFTTGDPVIGASVNLGPNTYLAANSARNPADPPPFEPALQANGQPIDIEGYEPMALFEVNIGSFISGKSATLADRPTAAGFISPLDAAEKAVVQFVNPDTLVAETFFPLTTFERGPAGATGRLKQLKDAYNALTSADQTGTAAGRNLKTRIDHLTPNSTTLPPGWDGKEEYTGKVNDSITIQAGSSSVISYLAGFTGFTFFAKLFTFHSDELCGHNHGWLVANTAARVAKDCIFVTDRSTFGKDEIDAMLHQTNPGPAVITAAFYVMVDGFRPGDLGITAADLAGVPSVFPTITPSPAVQDMIIGDANGKPASLLAVDPSLPNAPQRFTWVYPITFKSTNGFIPGGQTVTLTAAIGGVTGNAQIQLTEVANVYEVDGPVSWLSSDTRVFLAKAGDVWLNAPALGGTLANASSFIKSIISNLNSGNTANSQNAGGYQTFDALPSGEDTSPLALYQTDHNNTPVFNFAVARVRYRALTTPANNVRVFFRLCPALSVSVDYNLNTTYRRSPVPNPDGHPIPILGVQGGNVVTIPFFAEPRKDASMVSMESQTDPANVQPIAPDATGAEVEAYFGCLLDINQPGQKYYPLNPAGDGPYSGSLNSVLELVRNDHQCLLAEIVFDPDPITGSPSPANSDKLAQRNLSLVPSDNPGAIGSRRIPNTFELKPTPFRLASGQKPDELLIDWGNTPRGSTAQIYIPSLQSSDLLKLASNMYSRHRLTAWDAHTLQCPAEGITYVPIPPGTDVNYAGLLTVDLPAGVRRGQLFKIVVRQLTNAGGVVLPPPPPIARIAKAAVKHAAARTPTYWRRVLGSFQISIPVSTAKILLQPEERRLSIFRYIEKAIPASDRWYPVFQRFVNQIGDRVSGFGGNPNTVLPSPTGGGEHQPGHKHKPTKEDAGRVSFIGKVTEIIYDRFGDFEGFVLDTEDGNHRFTAREPEIERVVNRAWSERIVTSVFVALDAPHRPEEIALHCPPKPF